MLYLFKRQSEIECLTYLDADIFIFANPAAICEQLGDGTILLIALDCSETLDWWRRQKGLHSVGINVFRRAPATLACLRRWREQCLEWCYNVIEPTRFGD